ncbi:hypothetical protein NIES80_33400 [Dolichospermum planctonicum]|uniref:Uncharacterized protein n=1 Tax=Dolichospermum planctonicum TaxID=136072 RepID=A0A480AGZ1_9CYAN|nr:hypothetical protein NIES80_33400 [Dolichospermum planctonicum]
MLLQRKKSLKYILFRQSSAAKITIKFKKGAKADKLSFLPLCLLTLVQSFATNCTSKTKLFYLMRNYGIATVDLILILTALNLLLPGAT